MSLNIYCIDKGYFDDLRLNIHQLICLCFILNTHGNNLKFIELN